MVKSFKNHSSVLFWSMGNEASLNKHFDTLYDSIEKLDPTRPVHYESGRLFNYTTHIFIKKTHISSYDFVSGKYTMPFL